MGVGLVTAPLGEAGVVPLANLATILATISTRLNVITGGAATKSFHPTANTVVSWVDHRAHISALARILSYGILQCRMTVELLKSSKRVECWMFFIGGDTLVLPILGAKIIGKKVILVRAGSSVATLEAAHDRLSLMLAILSTFGQVLANRVIVYSQDATERTRIRKRQDSIFVARHHYLDLTQFRSSTPLDSRPLAVGYLGRLNPEKGVRELVLAVPLLLKVHPDIQLVIVGEGPVRNEIEEYVRLEHLESIVRLQGWVAHDTVPSVLNSLRVIVIPSYTEGLPNVLIESMACGTPVVATAVGSIPYVIQDCTNGFLVTGNSPEELVEGILKALSYPDLDGVVARARAMAESEFSLAIAIEGFRKAMDFA